MSLRSKWHVALALVIVACQSSVVAISGAQSKAANALQQNPERSDPIDLQHGVAVVAVGSQALDAAWSLATRLYATPLLRPSQLDDATARALAGEAPAPGATARVRNLAETRSSLRLDDPTTPRLLASLASELGGPCLLLVHMAAPSTPRARLYVTSSRSVLRPDLWQQPGPEGTATWEAAVAWLHGHALASSKAQPTPATPASKSVFKSGWFWGAVAAAAGATVLALTIRHDDSPDTIHLQGKVGP